MNPFIVQVNIKSSPLHNSNQVSIDTTIVEILTLIDASFSKNFIHVMITLLIIVSKVTTQLSSHPFNHPTSNC